MTGRGQTRRRACRIVAAVAMVVASVMPERLLAQTPAEQLSPPRPPAPIGPPGTPPASGLVGPPGVVAPPAGALPAPPLERSLAPVAPPQTTQSLAPGAPIVPPGQVALAVSARFSRDPPSITGGLHWRIYADRAEPTGQFRLIKDDKSASPTFVLPPGGYVVHVTFGLANAVKRVQLRQETVREVFEIPAGGARFEGRVGDAKIPPGQISFEVYKGSQFEPGDKRPLAKDIGTSDVVLLPEGTYHVVSNYGDSNAVVRSDIRVQPGKLTDVTINHRAAVITMKLAGDRGGEALANTEWFVMTPAGDVVKESRVPFPRVILAEGEYVAIAKNEGKVYCNDFKVEPGVDGEVEVLTRKMCSRGPEASGK
jgi:hypothetical protein